MDPKAILKAKLRETSAADALDRLCGKMSFAKFSADWFVFLSSWKSALNALEQGAKVSARSQQWYGTVKARRKAEPMLTYLFHARNDDEHGIEEILAESGARLVFKGTAVTDDSSIAYRADGNGVMGFVMIDKHGNEEPMVLEQAVGDHIALATVTLRDGQKIEPPVQWQGKHLKYPLPVDMAKIGLEWLSEIIIEAEAAAVDQGLANRQAE